MGRYVCTVELGHCEVYQEIVQGTWSLPDSRVE